MRDMEHNNRGAICGGWKSLDEESGRVRYMSPIVEISKAPHVRAWSVAERDRQQKDMDADIVEWSVESELNTGSKLASILVRWSPMRRTAGTDGSSTK